MSKLFSGSIDVTKIDKDKLVVGEKGTYLNILISLNDEEDQFGNIISITQGQSKEEREAGEKKVYLGNCKLIWESQQHSSLNNAPAPENTNKKNPPLPF